MNELITKDEINIQDMIFEVKGKQVMLDSDLAKLYNCKNGTKEINQAVKNNLDKFPERFSWKLSNEECKIYLVKIFDQNKEKRGGRYKNPRVFTEQGVAMLATILKSSIATQVSIRIMDAFVSMRHYIGNNEYRIANIETKIIEHDSNIKLLQESFKKFEEKKIINEIYFKGQIYDAYSKIIDIFKTARDELIIIDAYSDKTTLDMIRNINCTVFIITKNQSLLTNIDIKKYKQEYHNLKIYYNNSYHDRYFIIDKSKVYHCGASINYAGSKTFSINILDDDKIKRCLIEDIEKIIKQY